MAWALVAILAVVLGESALDVDYLWSLLVAAVVVGALLVAVFGQVHLTGVVGSLRAQRFKTEP